MRVALLALLAGGVLGVAVVFLAPLAATTVLLALVTGFAIFVRPEVGVLAFVAVANLLPFGVMPIRIVYSPTLVDFVLTTLLASWVFWTLHRERPLVHSVLTLPIIIYLGLALTAFVLGLAYSISPERLRLFLKSINSTLFFFSVINCVTTRASLRRAVVSLMVGATLASAIAAALLYTPEATAIQILSVLGPLGYPTGPQALRPIADTEIQRAIGTSIDPNVLGGLLMMGSTLLIGQVFSPSPLLDRKLLWPMLAITVVGLLLTHSRSALGGMVVGAVLIGIFRDRRLLLLLLAAAALLPFIPQADVLVDRLRSGIAFQDRAAAMRLDEYRDALNLIARYPFFGIGFGEPPSIDLYLGVSSIYLLVAQEMGLVGLSSFLLILALLAWQILDGLARGRDEETRGTLLSLGAAMAAATSAGLLDHYFVNIVFPHMVALFWLYVGLTVVAARLAREA